MLAMLKVSPQIGATVRAGNLTGTVRKLTAKHVLIECHRWYRTSVWMDRKKLKGFYK